MKHDTAIAVALAALSVCATGEVWHALNVAEAQAYRAARDEAVRFTQRMGVVHGGCSNCACSGLLDGKPVRYTCSGTGCSFDE